MSNGDPVITGQACLALLSLIPATKDKFDKASQEFMACFNNRGILSSLLGAFMLGVGMTLSGAVSLAQETITLVTNSTGTITLVTNSTGTITLVTNSTENHNLGPMTIN